MSSSRTVYKYVLPVEDTVEVIMPDGAEVLHIGDQAGTICLWALVDPDAPRVSRWLRIAGTGHPIAGAVRHLGSVVTYGGALVWHVFEEAAS